MTHPPITTALLHLDNYDDFEDHFGPRNVELSLWDHDGITLDLLHDSIMAGLSANIREKLRTSTHYFIGTLYAAFEKHDMSMAAC